MESGNISPSKHVNASDPNDRNAAPGTLQDYSTRQTLKRQDRHIRSNEKWVLVSLVIEVIVFSLIIASWIHLSGM